MCSKQEIDALCGSNRKTVVEEYVFFRKQIFCPVIIKLPVYNQPLLNKTLHKLE